MKLSLDELEYLLSRMRVSCPSDGVLHKRIEAKIATEINERKDALDERERLDKVFGNHLTAR
jgi:hypothetical protein